MRIVGDHVLALEFLPEPWRNARVGDLQDADTLAGVLGAMRRLQGGRPPEHPFCPFARIEALAREVAAVAAPLPDGTGELIAASRLIDEAVRASGLDLRP